MKIIHVLNHFLPGQVAGTEVYVWALSKALQNTGANVSILIPNYHATTDHEYEYDGLKVYCYAEPTIEDRAIITGVRLPEGLKNFTAYVKRESPDVIHFHEIAGSTGISLAHFEKAKESGAKIIFTMHLAGNTCRTGTLMYKGTTHCHGKIILKRCSYCALLQKTGSPFKATVLLGASMPLHAAEHNPVNWQHTLGTALSYPFQITKLKKDLVRLSALCDAIIPITNWYYNILKINGVPAGKLRPVLQAIPTRYETSKNMGEPTSKLPVKVLFIGRIDELKGISLLLETAKQFSAAELELDIYGGTSDTAFLNKCKDATASASNIQWKGKLPQAQVVPVMRKYGALVLPSRFSEMSPLVIQEAFAAGLPVIGSNVYGISEQIKDGVNGFLFQFEHAGSLLELLKKLVASPELLYQVRRNILPPRSFEDVASETFKIYQSVLPQNIQLTQ